MPSGADLEYQRMLRNAGINQLSAAGTDGAYLEQLGDIAQAGPRIIADVDRNVLIITQIDNQAYIDPIKPNVLIVSLV